MISTPSEIKNLYIEGLAPKRIRVTFPEGQYPTITNDNIVAESFVFNENLVQGDSLKFGICEASMIKFDAYEIPNIQGLKIKLYIDIKNGNEWHETPLGVFKVKSQKVDRKTGKNSIEAYTPALTESNLPKFEQFRAQEVVHIGAGDHVYNLSLVEMELGAEPPEDATIVDKVIDDLNPYIGFIGSSFTKEFDVVVDGVAKHIKIYYIQTSSDRVVPDPYVKYVENYYFGSPSTKAYKYLLPQTGEGYGEVMELLRKVNLTNVLKPWYRHTITQKNNHTVISDEAIELEWDTYYPLGIDGQLSTNTLKYDASMYIPESVSITTGGIKETYMVFNLRGMGDIDRPILCKEATVTLPVNYGRIDVDFNQVQKIGTSSYTGYVANAEQIKALNFVKIISDYYETQGILGKYDRNGVFRKVFLKTTEGAIYPSNNIYPNNDLYPEGRENLTYTQSMYQDVVADANDVQTIGTIGFKYLSIDQQKEIVYKGKIGESTRVYETDDNYFFMKGQNGTGIYDYRPPYIVEEMAVGMGGIKYTPTELIAQGLPFVETGDTINIETPTGTVTTLVLTREMKGIQGLTDTIEASADNTKTTLINDTKE